MNDLVADRLNRDLEEVRAAIRPLREEIHHMDTALMRGETVEGKPVDEERLRHLRTELSALQRRHAEILEAIEGKVDALENSGALTIVTDWFVDNKGLVAAVAGIGLIMTLMWAAIYASSTSDEEARQMQKALGIPSAAEQTKMMVDAARGQIRQQQMIDASQGKITYRTEQQLFGRMPPPPARETPSALQTPPQ